VAQRRSPGLHPAHPSVERGAQRAATTSYGVGTPPQQVDYPDLLRVWREADEIPDIEHAWLFDHLMPIGGEPNGPAYEGWTLLSGLAAQTEGLRLGTLVTSNRFRPPALLAKMAATVDVVSGGWLEFGIGAGSNATVPIARREYAAHGLAFQDPEYAVGSLAEALPISDGCGPRPSRSTCTARDLPRSAGAFCNPKPLQQPHPPIVIGGRSTPALRVVAEHADVWSFPGGDVGTAAARSALLDRLCAEIGRDPADTTRSLVVPVSYDDPAATRSVADRAVDAGLGHIVLTLLAPYPRASHTGLPTRSSSRAPEGPHLASASHGPIPLRTRSWRPARRPQVVAGTSEPGGRGLAATMRSVTDKRRASLAHAGAALLRVRWFVRAPIWLYRARLGFVYGSRLLLLEHTGRSSGLRRYVVLEIVDHPAPDRYVVVAGFGDGAQWYRNVEVNPQVHVRLGSRKSAPAVAHCLDVRPRRHRWAPMPGRIPGPGRNCGRSWRRRWARGSMSTEPTCP